MTKAKIKVGIVGVTGYGGGELARLLLAHPHFDLCYGSSTKEKGAHLGDVHANLKGLYDLVLKEHPGSSATSFCDLESLDALFLAMPHGKSMELMPHLPESLKVVDLAGDYRLKNLDDFSKYYQSEHKDFSRVEKFVYGLSEVYREKIKESSYVANPGCFATAVQLCLYPFAQKKVIKPRVIVDAKTGSSGSGASARATTHHPFRDGSFYAYKMLSHQHLPEILQTLRGVGFEADLLFQVHSAPMVRGIFASAYMELNRQMGPEEIKAILQEAYGDSPFVRLIEGSPNVQFVAQSNFADIGFAVSGKNLVVFTAIDNLVKGAAGQAIQNMNLMWGFDEDLGLKIPGGYPR